MTKKTWKQTAVRALKGSIKHWEEMRDGGELELDPSACACCQEWNQDWMEWDTRCRACPIAIRTGRRFCGSTPYVQADRFAVSARHGYRKDFEKLAQKEVDFLLGTLQLVRQGKIKPER